MFAHNLRRRDNIKTTVAQRLVFAVPYLDVIINIYQIKVVFVYIFFYIHIDLG